MSPTMPSFHFFWGCLCLASHVVITALWMVASVMGLGWADGCNCDSVLEWVGLRGRTLNFSLNFRLVNTSGPKNHVIYPYFLSDPDYSLFWKQTSLWSKILEKIWAIHRHLKLWSTLSCSVEVQVWCRPRKRLFIHWQRKIVGPTSEHSRRSRHLHLSACLVVPMISFKVYRYISSKKVMFQPLFPGEIVLLMGWNYQNETIWWQKDYYIRICEPYKAYSSRQYV